MEHFRHQTQYAFYHAYNYIYLPQKIQVACTQLEHHCYRSYRCTLRPTDCCDKILQSLPAPSCLLLVEFLLLNTLHWLSHCKIKAYISNPVSSLTDWRTTSGWSGTTRQRKGWGCASTPCVHKSQLLSTPPSPSPNSQDPSENPSQLLLPYSPTTHTYLVSISLLHLEDGCKNSLHWMTQDKSIARTHLQCTEHCLAIFSLLLHQNWLVPML